MGEEARDYEDTEKRTREPKGWRAEMDSALMSVLLRRSTSSSEVLRSGVERGEKGDGERRRERARRCHRCRCCACTVVSD